MFLKRLVIIIFIFCFNSGYTQTWEQLEIEYNTLLNNKRNYSALIKAKEMYSWVKVNEGDTSLSLPISLKLIGNAFMNLNKDSALYYYDLGLNALDKQNKKNNIQAARINYNISNIYYNLKLTDKALEYALKSASLLNVIGYSEYPFCIWPLKRLAEIYSSQKDFKSALPYELQSFKISKRILGDKNKVCANSLYNIGILCFNLREFNSAENYLLQSLIIFKDIDYPEYNNPTEAIYSLLTYYDNIKAPKYKYENLWLNLIYLFNKYKKSNTEECADAMQSLGSYYSTIERYNDAEKYIKESIESCLKSIGEINLLCSGNYFWLGMIYDRKQDYISAEFNYLKSIEIFNIILPNLSLIEKKLY